MSIVTLKVKVKSLAAEAVIIRREENKQRAASKWQPENLEENNIYANNYREQWLSLKSHRRCELRDEARSALLAYGYLRGRAYKAMESKYHEGNAPDRARVLQIVKKFVDLRDPWFVARNRPFPKTDAESIKEWFEKE